MFKAVLFASLLAVSSAIDLDTYTYAQFVQDFQELGYKLDDTARQQAFENELVRVRDHNAHNRGWQEGINKYSAMTAPERDAYFGRSKAASHHFKPSARQLPPNANSKPVTALPTSVDWRNNGVVSAVKNQGSCGSCWAFSATETIESHVALSSGKLFALSTEQVAMCTPNPNECGGSGGCDGAVEELAFDYVSGSNGLFLESQYPYTSGNGKNYPCSLPSGSPAATVHGFVKLSENNYADLMNAVATVGPVSVSVDASRWSAYSSGIFDGCNQVRPDINHGVQLVGYGTEGGKDYWIVRNSWGPSWGEKGFIRVLRTANEQGRCGTDTTPQDGSACKGETDPVTVCGTCGILYDSSYPLNATAL